MTLLLERTGTYLARGHPSIHPYRQRIIDTVCSLFGEDSLAVMWNDVAGLSGAELADLGFRKIAGAELIFRHNALGSEFSKRFPEGQNSDDARHPRVRGMVMREWERFE